MNKKESTSRYIFMKAVLHLRKILKVATEKTLSKNRMTEVFSTAKQITNYVLKCLQNYHRIMLSKTLRKKGRQNRGIKPEDIFLHKTCSQLMAFVVVVCFVGFFWKKS